MKDIQESWCCQLRGTVKPAGDEAQAAAGGMPTHRTASSEARQQFGNICRGESSFACVSDGTIRRTKMGGGWRSVVVFIGGHETRHDRRGHEVRGTTKFRATRRIKRLRLGNEHGKLCLRQVWLIPATCSFNRRVGRRMKRI